MSWTRRVFFRGQDIFGNILGYWSKYSKFLLSLFESLFCSTYFSARVFWSILKYFVMLSILANFLLLWSTFEYLDRVCWRTLEYVGEL